MPDFRGRLEEALDALSASLPDVLNHNLETVPRLYKLARPGADYAHSLKLLKDFKARFPHVPTKSGLMLGLGETDEEVLEVMRDLRAHDVNMLTIGQYLQPSDGHLPVLRYAPLEPSRCSSKPQKKWASAMPPAARWCAAVISPMSRRIRRGFLPTSDSQSVTVLNSASKLARQSPRTQVRGGKSGLHRAGCRLMAGHREVMNSATENKPPKSARESGEGEMAG